LESRADSRSEITTDLSRPELCYGIPIYDSRLHNHLSAGDALQDPIKLPAMGNGGKILELVQHLWRLRGVDGELLEDLSVVLQQ
jgi:hypothetical protein